MESLIARLGLALAIGLLVGLERGWRERDAPDHRRTEGIRTFGVFGLLGGIFTALAEALGSQAVLVAAFLGFSAILAWYKAREATRDKDYSVTSVAAGLGVFGFGALAVAGDYRAAGAGGAGLAAVLASRNVLHDLLRQLTWIELRSALVLAVMMAVVLPLLPDRMIDPWGGLNPFEIWVFTVLVAAISYLGYVAVRMLGEAHGLLVSTLAGAVVSSTAVAVALARTVRTGGHVLSLAGSASLAAMVSVLCVCFVVLILQPEVLAVVGIPALMVALCLGAFGGLLLFGRKIDTVQAAQMRNPFDLLPLLLFAVFFAVMATVNAALSKTSGGRSFLVTSALSGIFDVDVAVLSALHLLDQAVAIDLVGAAVLIALLANALGRLVLAAIAGLTRFGLLFASATLLAVAAGFAAYALPPSVSGPTGL